MATAHPEAVAVRDDDANELEATELHNYQNGAHSRPPSSTTTAMDVDAGTGDLEPPPSPRRSGADVIRGFWKRHVVVTVAHDACRDHFALERTYLGYVRTSLALSIVGIVIAQLFRLQHSQNPSRDIGFFVIGIPLASTCIVAAILVMLLGGYRFWRQQNAMLRGKVHAGGWEVDVVAFITFGVTFAIFVLVIAVDITKE